MVVNNAGTIDPIARIEDSDPGAWASAVDVNLKGAFYVLREAVRVMKPLGGGTIITISSGAANAPMEGWSHYCTTKAAVQMLTRCADKEHRQHGIRALGLSPGTVATDMQASIKSSGINPVEAKLEAWFGTLLDRGITVDLAVLRPSLSLFSAEARDREGNTEALRCALLRACRAAPVAREQGSSMQR